MAIFKKYFIYLFLERGGGREKGGERNFNVCLPLVRPLLGIWPETQACALTGNRTSDPLLHSPCSIHWAIPARVNSFIINFPITLYTYESSFFIFCIYQMEYFYKELCQICYLVTLKSNVYSEVRKNVWLFLYFNFDLNASSNLNRWPKNY